MTVKTKQTLEYLVNGTKNELTTLMKKSARLTALDHAIKQHLSIPLANYCKVANLRQGKLIIQTDSSVWASKLRFDIPALLSKLRLDPQFASLAGIDFFVQPINTPSPPPTTIKPTPKFNISAQNRHLLLKTAENIRNERLRKVLEALAEV